VCLHVHRATVSTELDLAQTELGVGGLMIDRAAGGCHISSNKYSRTEPTDGPPNRSCSCETLNSR
jgi:hypothetical protein